MRVRAKNVNHKSEGESDGMGRIFSKSKSLTYRDRLNFLNCLISLNSNTFLKSISFTIDIA